MNLKGGKTILILLSGFFYCFVCQASGLININSAGIDELISLPGIGPSKAQAIVDYRDLNGPFLKIEDIMLVSGIGQVTYDGLRDLISVESLGIPAESTEEDSGEENLPEEPKSNTPIPGSFDNEESVDCVYKRGDIVINEFVSDPADGEVEWIELYNKTDNSVSMSMWYIIEGSGAKTILDGSIGASGADKYFIIEKPKGNLNNAGDLIELYCGEVLIDRVIYGNWENDNSAHNALVPKDPASLARQSDGYDTRDNAHDFKINKQPTKKAENIFIDNDAENEESQSASKKESFDLSKNIYISEILPRPYSNESEDEYIELYNNSDKDIDLTGWSLGDESQRRFKIKADRKEGSVIGANGYLVFYRRESKIALNNNSDTVKLIQALKTRPLRSLKYSKAENGQSYNLLLPPEQEKYAWSADITPGARNIAKEPNRPPLVDFEFPAKAQVGAPLIFDSGDTFDEDGDELQFHWDFGDGFNNSLPIPEHTYFKNGKYKVVLTVKDSENEVSVEKMIMVGEDKVEVMPEENKEHFSALDAGSANLIINEIFPAPKAGSGRDEFIEIYNRGEARINLRDWSIDDSPGGSKPYFFKEEFMLEAGKYFVLEKSESGLALNNDGDEVRLFNPGNDLIDFLVYEKAPSAETYARGLNDKWFWTTVLTPGKENAISVKNAQAVMDAVELNNSNIKIVQAEVELKLASARLAEVGTKVRTRGTVAVLPGVLGAQYFYIVGSAGIQVYNYKKDFPELKIGNYIEVTGEISESGGEKRIKTVSKEDMLLIEENNPPEAILSECAEITEDRVGELVALKGQVVKKQAENLYFDDGSAEVRVYVKKTTGINLSDIKAGDYLSVVGIIGSTVSGLRIMPRMPEDIVKISANVEAENEGELATPVSAVLGEIAVNDEWKLPARDKKLEIFKYLLAIALFLIAILGFMLFRLRK